METFEQTNSNGNVDIGDLVKFLRGQAMYETSCIKPNKTHPFHKRYSSKPDIFNSILAGVANLCMFKFHNKFAESLELQEAGLTKRMLVLLDGKQMEFRTALEAECFIADYLSED